MPDRRLITKPGSITSRVLQAYEQYGWDKPTDFIADKVGPIKQTRLRDYDPRSGYRRVTTVEVLTRNRVSQILLAYKRRLAKKDYKGINLSCETVIPLSEVPAHLPKRRPVCRETLWRWTRMGVNGVVLESFKVGREPFTTVEAVARFIQRQMTG